MHEPLRPAGRSRIGEGRSSETLLSKQHHYKNMATLIIEAHRKRLSIKTAPMKPLRDAVASALASLKLEDVDPSSCKLLLNKKELDLNCPVRLANIPSTAKLELITGREPRLGVQDANLPPPAATAAPAAALATAAAPAAAAGAAAAQPAPQPAPQSVAASDPVVAEPVQTAAESQAAMQSTSAAAAAPISAAPAAPTSSPGGSAEAGHSGSQAAEAAVQQEPVAAAPAAQEGQHPSVAVFGQEVHVFTREAELAAESEHMAIDDREPPDSFYEFTEGDFQKVAAGLARARVAAEGGGHLMTKQMREAEEARRAASFGPVTLRVTLPDGHVLQAAFPAAAPLAKLRGVVRRALVEGVGERFHLYTTPPKSVLKDMAASFYQAKLVPAARVHVGLESGLGLPAGTPLLRPEVLQLLGAPPDRSTSLHPGQGGTGAGTVGSGGEKRNGEGGRVGPAGAAGSGAGAGGSRQGAGSSGAAAGGAKLPKWMKLGGK